MIRRSDGIDSSSSPGKAVFAKMTVRSDEDQVKRFAFGFSDQAGIFLIQGYDDTQRKTLIGTYCPSSLFPYLREAVSSIIGKGGFPAMLLQPINFDVLFAQAMQQQAQQAGNA